MSVTVNGKFELFVSGHFNSFKMRLEYICIKHETVLEGNVRLNEFVLELLN